MKVYDWITNEAKIHSCVSLVECCVITDEVYNDFTLDCSSDITSLWVADSNNTPDAGTISVSFEEGCGDVLDVFVNGSFSFYVDKGGTRSVTVESLRSLEVRCPSGEGACKGNYSLSIHQKLEEISLPNPVDSLDCYLTDPYGNRFDAFSPDAIECVEIPQDNGRKNEKLLISNGHFVTLQRVILRKKGCLAVEFKRNGQLCKILVPFKFKEQLFLCAPEGTRIKCEISAVDCLAIIQENGSGAWIEVIINVCQSIQSEVDITTVLEGELCKPRVG
ncbi:S-Ena type endospore appendage [Oceanobacillus profundus]|uniref:S-Ena type endospore appendage n=2 Tax=Oceanobacillus TaxID=182709 RepID=UPI0026E48DDE|nr:S-Ena type endospore appendage [Oceanobacillus profundus]